MNSRRPTELRINKSFLTLFFIIFIGCEIFDYITPNISWIPIIIIVMLPSFLVFIRTKNKFVLTYFLIWSSIYSVGVIPGIIAVNGNQLQVSLFMLLYFVFLISLLFLHEKLPDNMDIRYFRNILRMAANPITDCRDGYTDRLYPMGKIEVKKMVIEEFGKFANYNLIATTYKENDKIILVLSNGWFQYIPFLKPAWEKVTYVALDDAGSYNVHIARKDYRVYKNDVTFDLLCASLGNLMMEIVKMYENESIDEIIKLLRHKKPENEWGIQHKITEKIESINKWILKK
jgi:hypothetical protein